MADATSRRERILEAAVARLSVIRRSNGYRTDLGDTILVGELPEFGDDDPKQVLAVLPKEDQIQAQQVGKLSITWPIDIAVLVDQRLEEPWRIVEAGLMDIKRAYELADRSLGGLLDGGTNNPEGLLRGTTETYPRKSGSEIIGALITYGHHFRETWGRPEL